MNIGGIGIEQRCGQVIHLHRAKRPPALQLAGTARVRRIERDRGRHVVGSHAKDRSRCRRRSFQKQGCRDFGTHLFRLTDQLAAYRQQYRGEDDPEQHMAQRDRDVAPGERKQHQQQTSQDERQDGEGHIERVEEVGHHLIGRREDDLDEPPAHHG
ncbi:MAG: hypothetical protein EOM10_10700 [Opitutae bacterium]|nr:hypothetical protein [Opitutae bacterium]